jgi:hypothetical protein
LADKCRRLVVCGRQMCSVHVVQVPAPLLRDPGSPLGPEPGKRRVFSRGRCGIPVGVTWVTRLISCVAQPLAQMDPTHSKSVPFWLRPRSVESYRREGAASVKNRDWVRAWRGSEGLGSRCRGMCGRGFCDRQGSVHRGGMVIGAGAAVCGDSAGMERLDVLGCVRSGRRCGEEEERGCGTDEGRGRGVSNLLFFPKHLPVVHKNGSLYCAGCPPLPRSKLGVLCQSSVLVPGSCLPNVTALPP